MIVTNTAEREIERFALNTEKRFSIRASGAAFKILSSSLYRDKIRAIIRELSCNAYDAHVAAGCKDKPFRVHLPNRLEPFFSVRDEGIGLSHDEIESIYTTYFESTKTDSNDYIGAMGLGSKSPFSYVDTFTVASRHNGMLRTYAAFISERGEPVITLMSEVPTDEGNGIEVSLPVKVHSDFHDFRNKAQEVLSRFAARPEVVGCSEFQFINHTKIVSGDGWHITKRATRDYETRNPYAIMGNVAYPIVSSSLHTLSDKAQRLYRLSLDIDFPIGSLEVTAGREDLSYDPKTLAALEAKAQHIYEDAPRCFAHLFDDCATEYEARARHAQMFSYGSVAHTLLKGQSVALTYKGIDITSNDFLLTFEKYPDVTVKVYDSAKSRYRATTFSAALNTHLRISASDENTIFIDDLPGRGGATHHIKAKRKQDSRRTLIVIKGDRWQVKRIIAFLDGFPVTRLSTLPKPEIEKTSKVATKSDTVSRITWQMWYRYTNKFDQTCWCSDIFPDLSQGGFYLRKRGHAVVMENPTSIFRILDTAATLKLFDTSIPVYGFDAITERKAKAVGKWVNIIDHITAQLKLSLANDTSLIKRLRRSALEQAYSYLDTSTRFLRSVVDGLPANHSIVQFYQEWQQTSSSRKEEEADAERRTLCLLLNVPLPVLDEEERLKEHWESIITKYPILTALQLHSSDRMFDVAHVIDYVLWIDNKQSLNLVAA